MLKPNLGIKILCLLVIQKKLYNKGTLILNSDLIHVKPDLCARPPLDSPVVEVLRDATPISDLGPPPPDAQCTTDSTRSSQKTSPSKFDETVEGVCLRYGYDIPVF